MNTSAAADMHISPERIRQHLKQFASVGYRPGGRMQRLAFNRHDLRARQMLLHIMHQIGLETRVDEFNNVFGRLQPSPAYAEEPPVLIGSHLDTVPSGGRFDGALGVAVALEVVTVMKAYVQEMRRPIEVVSFSCEESSRFGRGTLGSGLLAGTCDPKEILQLRDSSNRTLGEVLQRIGFNPHKISNAARSPGDYAAFIEIHVEQGRVLEESGNKIGIVTAVAAPTRFILTITGQSDHSGATPMGLRRDALCGAAEAVLAIEEIAKTLPEMVGTVGVMKVHPGAINVVPGQVELAVDVRGTSREHKSTIVEQIIQAGHEICTRRNLHSACHMITDEEPVQMDDHMVELFEASCLQRNIPYVCMPSGAGHDAMKMKHICPSGLLLAPSREGISHDPGEWTSIEDIAYGAQVYGDVVRKLSARQSTTVSP